MVGQFGRHRIDTADDFACELFHLLRISWILWRPLFYARRHARYQRFFPFDWLNMLIWELRLAVAGIIIAAASISGVKRSHSPLHRRSKQKVAPELEFRSRRLHYGQRQAHGFAHSIVSPKTRR
jgi:hypothetical protein